MVSSCHQIRVKRSQSNPVTVFQAMPRLPAISSIMILVVLPTFSFGQSTRYELGKRLQRFETTWEEAEPKVRSQSTSSMELAVKAFFSLRLGEAARQLDQAWLTLQDKHALDETTRWLISHRIVCDSRLFDATAPKTLVRLKPLYRSEIADIPKAKVRISLQRDDGQPPRETVVTWQAMIDGHQWKHGTMAPGDYRLSVNVSVDNRPTLNVSEIMVSYCERLDGRLRDCREQSRKFEQVASSTGTATVRSILDQLESLKNGNVPESDVPSNRRLRFCEELIEAKCESSKRLNAKRPGDYCVTLKSDKAVLPIRLNVPQKNEGPLPVIIAFHGAGGSENMFFETYGAGRLVRLAEQRGWLAVALRQGLFGLGMNVSQILDVLSDHFEIDRDKVFLVGHSMGAAQVVSQCERHGELVTKAVAIGGGRTPRKLSAVKHPEWLVAAGQRDFGRRGAATLVRGLRSAGVKVTYMEVPNVEHMVIVQASLDKVFRFLDGQ